MPKTPHQTWPCLGSCMLGTRCHPRASGFPSCPPCVALSGPSFALRSLWGRDCRKAPGKHQTWRSSYQLFPPAPAAFTSSSQAHTPTFPSPCLLSPITLQPTLAFLWQRVLVGSSGHPAGARQLTHTLGAGVSAQCLPIACRCQYCYGAFSTWWGVGQPLIRSTFKLSFQPFASPVEMPA